MTEIFDMDEAPTDGTVIEVLIDDYWVRAFWSDHADDMSPYGAPGWAEEESRMIMDPEAWREPEVEGYVDEYAEAEARYQEHENDKKHERQLANQIKREKTAENRRNLESTYRQMTGRDVSGEKIKMVDLRKMVQQESHKRSMEALGKLMQGFGL